MKLIRLNKTTFGLFRPCFCYELVIFNFIRVHWHVGGSSSDALPKNDSPCPLEPSIRLRSINIGGRSIRLPFVKRYNV